MHAKLIEFTNKQIQLIALIGAITVHVGLLLISNKTQSVLPANIDKPLSVRLLTDEPNTKERKKESATKPVSKSPQLSNKISQTDKSKRLSNFEKNTTLEIHTKVISGSMLQRWINDDAKVFTEQHNKKKLQGLRHNSYEKQWLDPTRVDTQTNRTSEKIETSEGIIHKIKVKGKTVCKFDVGLNTGQALNDLDLKPLSGKAMVYHCGENKSSNPLLDRKGNIKNSDVEDWNING